METWDGKHFQLLASKKEFFSSNFSLSTDLNNYNFLVLLKWKSIIDWMSVKVWSIKIIQNLFHLLAYFWITNSKMKIRQLINKSNVYDSVERGTTDKETYQRLESKSFKRDKEADVIYLLNAMKVHVYKCLIWKSHTI